MTDKAEESVKILEDYCNERYQMRDGMLRGFIRQVRKSVAELRAELEAARQENQRLREVSQCSKSSSLDTEP